MPQLWANWIDDVLSAGRFPITGQNRSFLGAWQSYEIAIPPTQYNPLNTTLKYGGSKDNPNHLNNGYPLQDYPSPQTGARATAMTLRNGRYPAIVAALQSGRPYEVADREAVSQNLRTWGSSNFAATFSVEGRTGRVPVASTPQSGFSIGGEVKSFIDAWEQGASDIGGWLDFLKAALWLLDPRNWLRAVEVIVGFSLMTLGLVFWARVMMQEGSIWRQVKAPPGDAEQRVHVPGSREGPHPDDSDEALLEQFERGEKEGRRQAAKRAGRESTSRREFSAKNTRIRSQTRSMSEEAPF